MVLYVDKISTINGPAKIVDITILDVVHASIVLNMHPNTKPVLVMLAYIRLNESLGRSC